MIDVMVMMTDRHLYDSLLNDDSSAHETVPGYQELAAPMRAACI